MPSPQPQSSMQADAATRGRRRLCLGFASTLALAAVPGVRAQRYPERPVRLLVPYPAGGGTDVVGRILQEPLRRELGQPVIIENLGGAGGSIGTAKAAQSAADGYTVLLTLSSHTINPAIYKALPYDVGRDFEPVSLVASLPQILVAHPSVAANTLQELIAYAREQGDRLSYAAGKGSPSHIAGELFKRRTGLPMVHIPYRGAAPAINDVLGNQVPLLWVSLPAVAAFVKQRKLKAYAVSTTQRSSLLPDVPTVEECGVPDFNVDAWYAMFVPAGTPAPIVQRLAQAVAAVVRQSEVRSQLLAQGAESVGSAPSELAQVVKRELPMWQKLVTEAKITAD